MPVFKDTPSAPTIPKQDIVQAFSPKIKSAVVDTRYTPQSDLIAYMEGSTWVVDYYSQIVDLNDELGGQDTASPSVLKQLRRIFSMELKVTQDLSQVSVDAEKIENTLQGSANVYPFLVPQVGDMFRAGIADGREGLFKVTRVEPRQIFKDKAHVIEYQLIAADDPARIYDLNEKTLVTYYFVKDFLLNLQNPLLEEADYHASKKLALYYYDMIDLYLKQFFSRETRTLVVPSQRQYVYDHGLTDFVKSVMESGDGAMVQGIRQLNIGDDAIVSSDSIWTMLLRRDPKLMKFIYKKAGLVNKRAFSRNSLFAGMMYTGIEFVVYPVDPSKPVDYDRGLPCEKPLSAETIVSTMDAYVPPLPPTDGSVGEMPLIKPIDIANGYVLSEAFYKRLNNQCSLLEKLLLDYIDFKLIAASDILKLCDNSYEWGPVERFYYFPLLLLLIRYNLRRL